MFQLEILNHPESFEIDPARIQAIVLSISESVPEIQKGIVHGSFVSLDEIQSLNREHRGKDAPTDVLSFHYLDDFSLAKKTETVAELIFSEEKIIAQSDQYHHPRQSEFEILLIHSLLHILGFDHEAEEDFEHMWQYESVLRKQFGLSIER